MEEDEVDWREFLAAQEWAELYIINTKPVLPISFFGPGAPDKRATVKELFRDLGHKYQRHGARPEAKLELDS